MPHSITEVQLACIIAALMAKLPDPNITLTERDMVDIGEVDIEVNSRLRNITLRLLMPEVLH